MHSHEHSEEVLFFVRGKGLAYVNGEVSEIHPGLHCLAALF
jgi:mannose-6-phosphate isomerase-like protein (cupin superfamily)